MKPPIRCLTFAVLTAGLWAADARYRDAVLAPAATDAAVRQADADGAARVAAVHERGNLADDATVGGTVVAAVACLATWRPRGRARVIDIRTVEQPFQE